MVSKWVCYIFFRKIYFSGNSLVLGRTILGRWADLKRLFVEKQKTIQVTGTEGLFHDYAAQMRRIAVGMGLKGQDTDDVLQEVYLEAQKRPVQDREPKEIQHWLIRMTINRCLWEFRRRKRYDNKLQEILQYQAQKEIFGGPDERLIQAEEVETVREALLELDKSLSGPMVLKYFMGMNSTEIGKILEMKHGTVRKRLYQGRIMLAKVLLKKGIMP